ncbi:MAG TPA: hypothetical protein DCM87_08830 [Planctomycetes bacterium]|jgi:hypothetical protein|nr:hypothetical protein [Planctomycetota bacterium]
MNPVLATFHWMLDALESAGVPYMVMGGWAVQAWGRPRPTFDVDFTLSLSEDEFDGLLKQLDEKGALVDHAFLKGFRDTLAGFSKVHISRFEFPDPIRVDLFLVRTEYQRTAFSRRRQVAMFGRTVWVMAPEDLILHKLMAGRHKDLAAVEEIVDLHRNTGVLDGDYLRHWAAHLSVGEELSRFLPS